MSRSSAGSRFQTRVIAKMINYPSEPYTSVPVSPPPRWADFRRGAGPRWWVQLPRHRQGHGLTVPRRATARSCEAFLRRHLVMAHTLFLQENTLHSSLLLRPL